MYLARFAIDGRDYVQGAATLAFDPLVAGGSGQTSSWRRQLLHVGTSLANFAPSWIALRIDFDGQRLVRHLFVTAAADRIVGLQRWMTVLSRLEREAPGSVLLTANANEHDRLLDHRNGEVVSVSSPVFRHRGVEWIERPARFLDALDSVFQRAMLEDRPLSYQAVLTPHRPAVEFIRRLRRDVLRLADLPGFGAARLARVQEATERYSSAQWFLSETGWLHEADGTEWLTERLAETSRRAGLNAPSVETGGPWAEGAAEGLDLSHVSSAPVGMVDAGAAIGEDALVWLLDWEPSLLPDAVIARPDPSASDAGPPLAEPPDAAKDFFFVSYARRDGSTIAPVLDQLGQVGVSFWYDRHIRGGDSWVRRLEERLECCRAVLLFLSPASALSRYVRSEATFAYTIGKPIFLVSLQPTDVPAGLRIILAGLQMTPVDDPHLPLMIDGFLK
jgi:hypothetical protein